MATKLELNAAIATVAGSIGTLVTEQAAAFQRLEDKLAAGGDFTAEVDQINALNAQIQAAIAVAQGKGI